MFAIALAACVSALAQPAGAKILKLGANGHFCVVPTTGDIQELPVAMRDIAARAAYRGLLQEVARRGGDRDRVLYVADPASCNATRGDVVVSSDLQVERSRDRYVLTLTASDGAVSESQTTRRENVRAWGATHARFPDPPAAGPDLWPDYLAVAVRIDSSQLAPRVIESLKIK